MFCIFAYLQIKEAIALALNQSSNVFNPLKVKFNVMLLLACVNYILKWGDRGHLRFSYMISHSQIRYFANRESKKQFSSC